MKESMDLWITCSSDFSRDIDLRDKSRYDKYL
jgi:hypothetical protein